MNQNDLPPHLRDDAPLAVCSRCGRKTVAEEEFGQECLMTQPDGSPCGGRFSNPRPDNLIYEAYMRFQEADQARQEALAAYHLAMNQGMERALAVIRDEGKVERA